MMKGVSYTRVSHDEQVEGTSLATQEAGCVRFCEQKGITVEPEAAFRDEGESAKDLSLKNRKQFLAALDYCRTHKDIKAFVVYKVDRFARNTEDHFAVRRLLRSYGVTLYSVTEPIGDSPAEKFVETVLAGAAEFDNAVRRQRCTDGLISRLKQGIWPFRPPVGYICAHHRKHDQKKTVPDNPDPILFPIIKRALKAYASGAITSQSALAKQLNRWGFAKGYGKRADPKLVDRLLGRYLDYYAGVLVNPLLDEPQAGAHQPMISQGEAALIRTRKSGKIPVARRTRFHPSFRLRRLLRCTACGRLLTACNSKGVGGTYGYYYCYSPACRLRGKTFRSDDVRDAFIDYLRRVSSTPSFTAAVLVRLDKILDLKARSSPGEKTRREHALRQLTDKRRRIHEMREDGAYDAATFKERLAVVDADIAALSLPADVHDLSSLDRADIHTSAKWLLDNAELIWEKLSDASRLRFEKIVFPEGLSYSREMRFQTTRPGLILAVSGQLNGACSATVDFSGISSNSLFEYCKELIALHDEMKEIVPGVADGKGNT